jgi:hypothetical protein
MARRKCRVIGGDSDALSEQDFADSGVVIEENVAT